MQIMPMTDKPRSETINPQITRLPNLTTRRRLFRKVIRFVIRIFVWLCVRLEVSGRDNLPRQGPLVIVSNHLGDADALVGIAVTTTPVEIIVKSELYYYPILGKVLDAYGVIWVHRGQPDRRSLRASLEALSQGRIIGIAPEGRESLTGSLEEGTGGAAYLAMRAKSPLLPVTFTHTENSRILGNLKRFRRTSITVTMGPVFYLDEYSNWRDEVEKGTIKIMNRLASQLPPEYQGTYARSSIESSKEQKVVSS
jgi:1-acyl-sn-glycerol-3-phosphate acyltransferase